MWRTRGAEGTAPWFFLSYAHLRGATSVDTLVDRFHADLSAALLRLVGKEHPYAHGFVDLPGASEASRRERRAAALARCRALVALCSPDYFTDFECHSEWTAFHQRQALVGSPQAAVVPVLWERLWTEGPVQAGLDRQALADQFGEDGLRAALIKPRLREEYERGVRRVAQAVLAAAERVELAPGDTAALDLRPSPWRGHPVERTLRILVLAYSRGDDLPPGCDRTRYGSRPQDWRPYGSDMPEPVAELAAGLVLARNLQVVAVEDFERLSDSESVVDRPTGPELLLLDRWALRSGRLRDRLLGYNQKRRHPMAVMVPWDPTVSDASAHDSELQELTLSTLNRAVGRPKPDFEQLRRGIPDAASFADQLPRAILQARQAFITWRHRSMRSAGAGDPFSNHG